ncbi:MAG: hypothetical protein ACTSPB_04775 [Candidatus Thorarchaeota archaeon]
MARHTIKTDITAKDATTFGLMVASRRIELFGVAWSINQTIIVMSMLDPSSATSYKMFGRLKGLRFRSKELSQEIETGLF